MSIRKKEIILFTLLLAAAAAAWFILSARRDSVDHGQIRITVDGREFGVYDLGKDQRIDINGHNTCRIRNGQAQMLEADCPDHLCVHMSPIDEKGGMIVCLPNKVFIEGIPSSEAGSEVSLIDAVVQ